MKLSCIFVALWFSSLMLKGDEAAAVRVKFRKVRQCPASNANLQLMKLNAETQCAFICARQSLCDSFHFRSETALCFLGNAWATLTQWTDGDCDTYTHVRTDALCSTDTGSESVLSQMQMKLFYRFSKSGLVNEANPKQFRLTASNVTVDSDGAKFKGHTGSYLSVNTVGFGRYLDYGMQHSFFVLLRAPVDSTAKFYCLFQQPNRSSPQIGNYFYRTGQNMYYQNWWTNRKGVYSYSQSTLPVSNQPVLLSVGVAFNGSAHQHFYFNGSLGPVSGANQFTFTSGVNITDIHDRLLLGYYPYNANCLNGSMYCFGMSSALLGLNEFKFLENYCLGN